jgi:hypothetical protein
LNIRQTPFVQSIVAARLAAGLLTSDQFRNAVLTLNAEEFPRFLRTYVEEGTPAAFYHAPILWESVRDWLANRLGVMARSIAIVGSAKTGFSYIPKKFGQPFSSNSDLDFSVVDRTFFDHAAGDARKFCSMVGGGLLSGRNDREKTFWIQNVKVISTSLMYGFVDTNKIPAMHDHFPIAARANNEASILVNRLKAMPQHEVRRASFRIFRSWDCFSARVRLNFGIIKAGLANDSGKR